MKSKTTMLLAGALLSAQFASGAEITVNSDITGNTTWTKDNVYILEKSIFVKNGAKLTIQPGTWILGKSNSANTTRGSLIVTRDGEIDAVGTKDEPIVFTAKQEYDEMKPGYTGPKLDPAKGDGGLWGGLVVLGNAPINFYTGPTTNANENEIEGFPAGSTLDIRYGGRDSRDSSGRLKYLSIRYGGYEFAPAKEINGLTFGGVGSGTLVEDIEIVTNTDDGFEIFGGTVNWKRVAVAFCHDDSFDFDEGWQGFAQFGFSIQAADGTLGDRGGEWDGGNGVTKTGTPYTNARLFNMTILGEGSTNTLSPNDGIFLDDNFAGQLHNSVVHDFGGVMVKDSGDGIGNPKPVFANTTFGIFGGGEGTDLVKVQGPGVIKGVDPKLRGISRIPNGRLDPRPATGSPLIGAPLSPFPGAAPANFFEKVNYRGAFGDENWLDGWSWLSQKGYLPKPVAPDAPVFSTQPKSVVENDNARVVLKSKATAKGTLTYQWFRNGKAIKGATGRNYTISRLTKRNAGTYTVDAILDGKLTTKSAPATVSVASLTAAKSAKAKVGKNVRVAVTSNFKANRYRAINLPAGLKINSKGVISGKPTAKGKIIAEVTGTRKVGKKTIKAERKIIFRVS